MYDLRGKRLLFLGSIRLFREPIEYAKKMGIYTIVADYIPDSPAKKYADKACLESATDVDAIVELCKKERVDGLFTAFIDMLLPYAREICDRMGFPFYASKQQIALSLDKRIFKDTCRKYAVPVPSDYRFNTVTDEFDGSPRFPVIVKPVDSSGGRGIRICRDKESLKEAYEYALSVSPGKNVIVEDYIQGDEITAVYTMKDGEVSLSCYRDKLISQDHENITSQGDIIICPSRYLPQYMNSVNDNVIALLKGMGATDGTVFFQGIANESSVSFFELGYRPNGNCDYRYISKVNQINYMKMMIAHALTGKMDGYDLSQDNPDFPTYTAVFQLWAHEGVIGSQEGLEEVLKIGNISIAEYMYDCGTEIKGGNTLAQRVFRTVIIDKNMDNIKQTVRQIQNTVQIRNTKGENMLYSPFDLKRIHGYKEKL